MYELGECSATQIRRKIAHRAGVEPQQIRLYAGGKPINGTDDVATLKANAGNNTWLNLEVLPRLRGGAANKDHDQRDEGDAANTDSRAQVLSIHSRLQDLHVNDDSKKKRFRTPGQRRSQNDGQSN